jgi:hypothetical protein
LSPKKYLTAVAVAAMLAACGGGSDTPTAATPQSAIETLRAQSAALAPMAVSATEAADQLMNFAQSTFPGFFPGNKSTQSAGPFAFRFYPETGVYLGVVVSATAGLNLHGVYVMGGAFGNAPVYVGPLTQFINVDIGGGGNPGGTGNGCYDLDLADTQGTHMQVAYQYLGTLTGTQTVDTLIGGMTTFQGNSAREATITTTGTNIASGFAVDGTFTLKNYNRRTATAEMTQYGTVMSGSGSSQGMTVNMNMTSVFAPPFLDRQYALGIGETYTASQTINTSGSISTMGFTQPISGSSTSTVSTKYVGRETITVPAGTYSTCKLETTTSGSGSASTLTSWVIVGKGITVKSVMTDGGTTQTIQATSVRLNGANL